MKTIAATALLVTSNFAAANGGLGIDNVEKHMHAAEWTNIQAERQEIAVQGPLDRFRNYLAGKADVVNVDRLKQNYDGQS